ncbi:unnamed protein product [Prorocentrum cordatum]|uniref:Uncharacterized protein n=1 Tax=Prorocentrum cordatum TaxID=2364126 RepID=A0ABN9TQ47_9DINO|nr:unnamed protein product [Polarella glacialis]
MPYSTAFPTDFPTPYPTPYPMPYPTPYPTPFPTAFPTPYPAPYPTPFPTAVPTPYRTPSAATPPTPMASTPAPTSAATPPTSATATGDPHLQNIHGDRFDQMTPSKVTLVNIPRGKCVEDALLAIEADARRLGGHCADIDFQEVNITGAWADKLKAGGVTFNAEGVQRHKVPKWMNFGPLEVKVVHGRTEKGIQYSNLFVKHLGYAGFAVGGLLGEDDHTDAARIPAQCWTTISLRKPSRTSVQVERASVATSS